MNRLHRSALLTVALVGSACSIFEDPTPETISVRMSGAADQPVLAIYSQVFVAGINQETSVTEVRITGSDTVMQTFPIDTIIDIAESRQLFLQVQTMPGDTADVAVRIDIDSRNVLDEAGLIFPDDPWRYVYQFNRPLTSVVDVVF